MPKKKEIQKTAPEGIVKLPVSTTLNVRMTLLDELLGTASSNPEVHEEHIASKSADKLKVKEELQSLPSDELMEKSITAIHRTEDGEPMLYDYQIRGFIKEALGALVEFDKIELAKGKKKISLSKWTYKRIVDNFVFVSPRKIVLNMPEDTEMGICTRPLRAETMKGERVALASSETVPAGTTFDCQIEIDHPMLVPLVRHCLNFGRKKGIGQWRNSGKGKFTWEEVEAVA